MNSKFVWKNILKEQNSKKIKSINYLNMVQRRCVNEGAGMDSLSCVWQ